MSAHKSKMSPYGSKQDLVNALCLLQLVHTLLRQAGFDKRTGDLYGNRDLFNKARNMARGLKVSFFEMLWEVLGTWKGSLSLICCWASLHMPLLASKNYLCWQGVENVYTQHQPLLAQTIESIMRGRLRDIDYPFVGNHFQQGRSVFCADTCPVQLSTACLCCCRSLTKTFHYAVHAIEWCCDCAKSLYFLQQVFYTIVSLVKCL